MQVSRPVPIITLLTPSHPPITVSLSVLEFCRPDFAGFHVVLAAPVRPDNLDATSTRLLTRLTHPTSPVRSKTDRLTCFYA